MTKSVITFKNTFINPVLDYCILSTSLWYLCRGWMLSKHTSSDLKGLTSSWGPVVATSARGLMVKVDVAIVRPQAAVVVTHDIVKPVGVPGHQWWLPVRRWAPVVSPVWGATTGRVSRQHQRACAVIAALLPRTMCGSEYMRTYFLFSVFKGIKLVLSSCPSYLAWIALTQWTLPGW